MTIQNQNNKMNYIGDGVTTIFAYNFRVDRAEDMSVYLDDILTGSGWIIDGLGDPNGGDVTFSVAPADQVKITLLREIAVEQLVDYVPYDPFPAQTHEDALDKLTMICQQLQEQLSRTLTGNPSSPAGLDSTLPPYDAGKGLMWSESELKMITSNDNFNDIVANAAASEANAAASEANALSSENKAEQWANEAEDVEVDPGFYSAFHWAMKASEFASGFPSGTKLLFYQASPPLGWTQQDIGDMLVAISGDVVNNLTQYDRQPPGGVGGEWIITGVSVDIPDHNHQWKIGKTQTYNSDGSVRSFDISGTQSVDGVLTFSGSDPRTDNFDSHTDNHSFTTIGANHDGLWRPKAAVCMVAEKD